MSIFRNMSNVTRRVSFALLLGLVAGAPMACEGPAEEAGEEVDDAADDVGDAFDDLGD